ncbi:MAG: rod shape-determining protein MreD [Bacilli bacterium]|nr:rod shape-determining protein MreD [Bacilli bacterium]
MIYIILIFSFLFEAAITNIIPLNSLLTPLFLLTSLTLLYPYFKNKKLNYIIVCIICGLFYDITLTSSSFINTLSFPLCGGLVILGYNYINYNIFSSNFLNIVILIVYRIITYLLLCIIDFISFDEMLLLEGIYNSLIANVIYGIFIYLLIDVLSKIFNIKRVE